MKSRATHQLRALLRSREMLVKSKQMLENHLRGILKAFGLCDRVRRLRSEV